MAVFTGQNGTLRFAGLTQVNVRNWAFTGTVDTLETTELGDDARTYVPGLKSATATATIMYHNDNDSLKSILQKSLTKGTPTAHTLQLIYGGKDIYFEAYITSVNVTCTVGDVMTADLSFTMTGDYQTLDL